MTMLNNQRLLNLMTIGLLLLGTAPTIAQSTANPSAKTDRILTRVLFKPPQDDKKPERTQAAGSRHNGKCIQDRTSGNSTNSPSTQGNLMPIVPSVPVPSVSEPHTINFGLTIAERPVFWIYLPENSATQIMLSIREVSEEDTKHHSQTFIPITNVTGVMSIQTDENSPPLEVGKTYQWAVVLVCGKKPSPNDPAIVSWVRRITPSETINHESTLEQAAWYGEQGIWYDALNSLIQTMRSQSNNPELIDIWAEFLNSGGIKDISTEPVLEINFSPVKSK